LINFPLIVIVPLIATYQLHKASAANILHSRAFEARYGWLCARCVLSQTIAEQYRLQQWRSSLLFLGCRYRATFICSVWELLLLEVRFEMDH
jgi:hypothetical protein